MLLRKGLISYRALEESVKGIQVGKRQGSVLVESGAIRSKDLVAGVGRHRRSLEFATTARRDVYIPLALGGRATGVQLVDGRPVTADLPTSTATDLTARFDLSFPFAVKRGYHMHYAPTAGTQLNHPVLDADGGYVLVRDAAKRPRPKDAPFPAGIRAAAAAAAARTAGGGNSPFNSAARRGRFWRSHRVRRPSRRT